MEGSTNFAELLALKILLVFALEKGCSDLQVFGDLMLLINWINKTWSFTHTQLLSLLSEVYTIVAYFNTFSCMHVYR